MEMCMDDKWKMSKKGSRRSAAVVLAAAASSPVSFKGRTARSTGRLVPGRLASLAREQRARFYIMHWCVTMLVCWRDQPIQARGLQFGWSIWCAELKYQARPAQWH